MTLIAEGKVVHAGTLNGNPLCLAAAKATIEEMAKNNGSVYQQLWANGEKLRNGMEQILRHAGLPVVATAGGPVFHLSFAKHPAKTYRETLSANIALYSDFGLALLDEGILALPDGRWYLSTAHTSDDIEQTLNAIQRVVEQPI